MDLRSRVNASNPQAAIAEAQREVEALQRFIQDLRAQERGIAARERALASQPQVRGGEGLAGHLKSFLPSRLVPGNVGGINTVVWPFWLTLDFDFGTNPSLTSTSEVMETVQVTQEAAMLVTEISRVSEAATTAGDLGPYTVSFRDRQSTRQFQDRAIPLQAIGSKSYATRFPTAMLIMPNAFLEVTMGTWLAAGETQNTTGSGKHQISLHGYRIRIEDTEKVLSTIFR